MPRHMLTDGMGGERHVRLFRNGRSQAVRIPREFELPGNEATIRKDGHRLVIEPKPKRSLKQLIEYLQSLKPIDEKIGDIPDLPPEPIDW